MLRQRSVARHGDVKTFCQSLDVTFHIWMKHSWRAGRIAQSEASCVFPLQFFDLVHEKNQKKTLMLTLLTQISAFHPHKVVFVSPVTKHKTFLNPSERLHFEDNNRSGCCSYVITRGTN